MPIYRGDTPLKPFKGDYGPVNIYVGDKKIAGWTPETKSGEAVDFERTYNDRAQVVVSGKSEQVQTVPGKNLVNNDMESFVRAGITATNNGDGTWTLDGVTTVPTDIVLYGKEVGLENDDKPISVKAGDVLYGYMEVLSGSTSSANYVRNFSFISSEGAYNANVISVPSNGSNSRTVQEDGYIHRFRLTFLEAGVTVSDLKLRFWLSQNQECPEYEPFIPTSPSPDYPSPVLSAGDCNLLISDLSEVRQTIPLPPLHRVGDVADSYNPETGEYVQRIGVQVFDGTESWSMRTSHPENHRWFYVSAPMRGGTGLPGYCTHYKRVGWNVDETGIRFGQNTIEIYVSTEHEHLDEYKSYLTSQHAAGTPVTVYYQLAEPVVTYLDPAVMPTYYPYTRLEQDGDVKGTIEATVKVME